MAGGSQVHDVSVLRDPPRRPARSYDVAPFARGAAVSAVDPYHHVVDFYEAEYGGLEADIAWWSRVADGGRLLVLGCGTGRVLRALPSDRRAVGLDRSDAMIARARAVDPGNSYVVADMADFDLGEPRFAEAFAPNGAFAFLRTRREQQACLVAVHRALKPGGALSIDVPMPRFDLLGTEWSREKHAWDGLVDGKPARRTRETWRQPEAQRLDLLDRYYVDDKKVAESRLILRLMLPGEIEWMLEASGFYVESVEGGYNGEPIGPGCDRILVRARAT
jgi:SAM-dependent methyltransferase